MPMLRQYNFIYTMRELRRALAACCTPADVNAVRATMRPGSGGVTIWRRFAGESGYRGTEQPSNGRWNRKIYKRISELQPNRTPRRLRGPGPHATQLRQED